MAIPLLEELAGIPGAEDIHAAFAELLADQPAQAEPDLRARETLHELLTAPDFDDNTALWCERIVAQTGTGPDLVKLRAARPSAAAWPFIFAIAEPIEVLRLLMPVIRRGNWTLGIVRYTLRYHRRIRRLTPAEIAALGPLRGAEIAREMVIGADRRPPLPQYQPAEPFPEAMAPPGGARPFEPPELVTRQAFALLNAPERVAAGEEFALTVGLSDQPTAGVLPAEPFPVPRKAFEFDVTLMADGFHLDEPVVRLRADWGCPFPSRMVYVTALDDPGLSPARVITATYAIGGRPFGFAARAIHVGSGDGLAAATEEAPLRWSEQDLDAAADLLIVLRAGDDLARECLLWSVMSPHRSVRAPDRPVRTARGGAFDWAQRVFEGIEARKDSPDLDAYLRGAGEMIADLVPGEVWTALEDAGRAAGSQPTVLLCTDEPDIPWELARVPGREVCLGARARVGRWVVHSRGSTPIPPRTLEVTRMAVVTGRYETGALPEADAEAAQLLSVYDTVRVEASAGPVRRFPCAATVCGPTGLPVFWPSRAGDAHAAACFRPGIGRLGGHDPRPGAALGRQVAQVGLGQPIRRGVEV